MPELHPKRRSDVFLLRDIEPANDTRQKVSKACGITSYTACVWIGVGSRRRSAPQVIDLADIRGSQLGANSHHKPLHRMRRH